MPSVLPRSDHADAEVGRHRRRLEARLLPGAVLEVGDVLRQAAHRRHDQRPGRARPARSGEPTPSATAMPCCGAGVDVDVVADLAGLGDQPQLGQLLEQLARKARAFADQHQHLGVAQPHRQLADALDGIGEHLRVQVAELGGARQLAHRVLVVVEDDDVHAADYGRPRRAAAVSARRTQESRPRGGLSRGVASAGVQRPRVRQAR